MKHITADDGRILTPPKELEPLLKGAYSAFFKTLGHIRFFYVADEIWDGKESLVFNADGKRLAAITLDDGVFYICVAENDVRVIDESMLEDIFEILKKNRIRQPTPPGRAANRRFGRIPQRHTL